MSNLVIAASALVYFTINYFIFDHINQHVSQPYMDEIFHVPQAQEYCLGNYNNWNDKITTLPGLYLLSSSIMRLIGLLVNEENILAICTTYNLRLTNLILSTFNFIIVYKIYYHMNSSKQLGNVLLTASVFSICLFPLNYFFQYLYYTDTGSTLFVLFAYYQFEKQRYVLSALSGSLAILFRQTNVVWITYLLLLVLLQNANSLVKQKTRVHINNTQVITNQRSRKHSNLFELAVKKPNELGDFNLTSFIYKLYKEDFWGKKLIYQDIYQIIDMNQLRPYIMTIALFIFFVLVNNGLVVGDRANHQAGLHLVQLFYFFSFSCLFTASSILFNFKKIKNLFHFLRLNFKLIFLVVLPLFLVIVKNFTYEHKFLLSDNRHFTFYIWSRIFRRYEFVRYALTPVYLAAIYLFYRNLNQTPKPIGWFLIYSLCLFVVLVPQQLIEFRYFIVPFLIYRFHLNQFKKREILFELLFNLCVNFATLYLFLYKPFYWNDLPSEVQRFMW